MKFFTTFLAAMSLPAAVAVASTKDETDKFKNALSGLKNVLPAASIAKLSEGVRSLRGGRQLLETDDLVDLLSQILEAAVTQQSSSAVKPASDSVWTCGWSDDPALSWMATGKSEWAGTAGPAKSAKSGWAGWSDASAKSAKSEWVGWSDASAKSAKSDWAGTAGSAKSAKSGWAGWASVGSAKSAKSGKGSKSMQGDWQDTSATTSPTSFPTTSSPTGNPTEKCRLDDDCRCDDNSGSSNYYCISASACGTVDDKDTCYGQFCDPACYFDNGDRFDEDAVGICINDGGG